MKTGKKKRKPSDAEYYNAHGVLAEITDDDVALSLDESLKEDILSGKRRRNLRNITIKIDPLYLVPIKKVATMKGIPYQTLVRQWFAEKIKKEHKIA